MDNQNFFFSPASTASVGLPFDKEDINLLVSLLIHRINLLMTTVLTKKNIRSVLIKKQLLADKHVEKL